MARRRTDQERIREGAYRRDLGRCASCKADTRVQRIRLEDVLRDCGYVESAPAYRAVLRELDLTRLEAKKSLWQADHVRAVEDGGGDDLRNIQTLCVRCHKAKNGRQASYRAKPRAFRPIKPAGLPGVDGFRGIGGKFDD